LDNWKLLPDGRFRGTLPDGLVVEFEGNIVGPEDPGIVTGPGGTRYVLGEAQKVGEVVTKDAVEPKDENSWGMPQVAAAQRGLQPVRWPMPQSGEAALSGPKFESVRASPAASRSANASGSGAKDVKRPPRLDIWPQVAASEILEVAGRGEDTGPHVVVLQNGFVHLAGLIPPDVQQRLVDSMRELRY